MKPLIRYTLGKVSNTGWHVLSESLRMIRKVYPEFDVVVCYNNLSPVEINRLSGMNDWLIDQSNVANEFNFKDDDLGRVRNFCWKLVPARIRIESHELWIDNDIVVRGRIEGVDNWLNSNTSMISKGFNKDYGRFSEHPDVVDKQACCAGFFGLPPNFDFLKEIKRLCGDVELEGFDEQGLVSLIVTSIDGFIILKQREMVLLSETWKPRPNFWMPNGLHFARSNRFDNHAAWKIYKKAVMP